MQVTIREANKQDLPELARLISSDEAWQRYGIDFSEALRLLEIAEEVMYVAENGGKVIGFCALKLNGVGNIGAYLRIIVVDEPSRSRGIGKMLIDYAFDLTVRHIPNLFLICSSDNVKAQRFYERLGFRPVGMLDDLVVPGHAEIFYRKTAGTLR